MSIYIAAQTILCGIAVILVGLAVHNLRVTRRLADVKQAQHQRETAYNALAAAYRSGSDASEAKKQAAEAEAAVQQAEDRLPKRSRAARRYFAAKGSS